MISILYITCKCNVVVTNDPIAVTITHNPLITIPEDEDCQAAADKAVAAAAVVAAAGHKLLGTFHNTLAGVLVGILDNCTPL